MYLYESSRKKNPSGANRPGKQKKEQKAARPVAVCLRPAGRPALKSGQEDEETSGGRRPVLQLRHNKRRQKKRVRKHKGLMNQKGFQEALKAAVEEKDRGEAYTTAPEKRRISTEPKKEKPKLELLLASLVEKKGEQDPRWLIEEKEIPAYARQVEELLEEIEKVDLQFMAAMMYEMQENGDEGLREERESYKGFLTKRIVYLDQMMGRVKEQIHALKSRKKTEDTVAALAASHGYFQRLMDQKIMLIKRCREGGDPVVNPNILLAEDQLTGYMAIEAPSTKTFKDIRDWGAGLETVGKKLQVGFLSPARSLTHYGRYLLAKNKNAPGTPPLIRSFQVPYKAFLDFEKDVISEHHLGQKARQQARQKARQQAKTRANAEDLKVPNQFGLPVRIGKEEGIENVSMSKFFRLSHSLRTYVEPEELSDELLGGSGRVEALDTLKERVGFGTYKEGKFYPSEFHFFDSEHTAFLSRNDSGDWNSYSYHGTKAAYERFLPLFEELRLFISGKSKNFEKFKELSLLLEANNFTPAHRGFSPVKRDARGNELSKVELEERIAGIIISEAGAYDVPILMEHPLIEKIFCKEGDPAKLNLTDISLLNAFGILKLNTDLVSFLKNVDNMQKLLMTLETSGMQRRFDILNFYFKLLRVLEKQSGLPKTEIQNFFIERDESSPDMFAKMSVLPRTVEGIRVPYDRYRSTFRFVRPSKDRNGIYSNPHTTFTGGASGTTRDIMSVFTNEESAPREGDSADMESPKLKQKEKNYWELQMLNIAFMIMSRYHSFFECIYPAAKIGEQLFGADSLSASLLQYLKTEYKGSEHAEIETLERIAVFLGRDSGWWWQQALEDGQISEKAKRADKRKEFIEYYKGVSHESEEMQLDPDILLYQANQAEMDEEAAKPSGTVSGEKKPPRLPFPIDEFELIPNAGGGDCFLYAVNETVRSWKDVSLMREELSKKFDGLEEIRINKEQVMDAVKQSFGKELGSRIPKDDSDLKEIYSRLLRTPGVFASSTEAVLWCRLTKDTVYIIEPYQCTKCTGEGSCVIKNVAADDVKTWILTDHTICLYLYGSHYQKMDIKGRRQAAVPSARYSVEIPELRGRVLNRIEMDMVKYLFKHSKPVKIDEEEREWAKNQSSFDNKEEIGKKEEGDETAAKSEQESPRRLTFNQSQFKLRANTGGGDCLLHALEGKNLKSKEVSVLRTRLAAVYEAQEKPVITISEAGVNSALRQGGFISDYREIEKDELPEIYKRVVSIPGTYLSSTEAALWCRLEENRGKTVYIIEAGQITQCTQKGSRTINGKGIENIREWLKDSATICLFLGNAHFERIDGVN